MKIAIIKQLGCQLYDVCKVDKNFSRVIEKIGTFESYEDAEMCVELLKRG